MHEKEMKLHLLTALLINQQNYFLCKTNTVKILFPVTILYCMGWEPLLQTETASYTIRVSESWLCVNAD